MEKTKLRVNLLPSRTWHWVGMNDSELEIALPDEAPEFTFTGNSKDLFWTDDVRKSYPSGEIDGGNRPDFDVNAGLEWTGWNDMETGMGDEFAAILKESQTAFLGIPEGYDEDGPVVIDTVCREGQGAGQILINAGAGSSSSVVIAIGGEDQNNGTDRGDIYSGTMALQLLLHAEEDAHIKLFVVQMMPAKGLCCLNIGGSCEKKSEFGLTDLSIGAQNAYIGIAVRLDGEESLFQGDMGYHVQTGQSVDINYVTRHVGRGSVSDMNAWGVLEDGSRKLFRGTIDFIEGCPGSKGAEKEDVLLMGEHQTNRTIPLILCHEEDVEGNHGATISRLDDQVLFYLGSRGLDAKTAESMVASSRMEALINKIPDGDVRLRAETASFSKEDGPFAACGYEKPDQREGEYPG